MMQHPEYLRLVCLTPVHVGSGAEYLSGIDFIARGQYTYLLESERVLERLHALGELPRDVSDLKSRIERLFRRESHDEYALARCDGTLPEHLTLRAALRAGNGWPIIPGSSLKGAMRTLLFAARIGIDGPHSQVKPELASQLAEAASGARPLLKRVAQPLENRIFHSSVRERFASLKADDAKRDLLRMLSLSDAAFTPDSSQLFVTAATGTARRTTLAVEALKRGSRSSVRIRLGYPDSTCFFAESLPPWETLVKWSRAHALHLLKTDHDYFSAPTADRRDCSHALGCVEELIKHVEAAPADTLFLRLGWGSGWRTMTGDLLDAAQRRTPLPKSGQFGPKTRKVIVKDAGSAAAIDVLGWLSLTPVSRTEALRFEADLRPPVRPGPPSAPAPSAPESRLLQIDDFLLGVEKLQARDWGSLPHLYQRALADAARKDARLAALGAKIAEVWKGDKRRLREAADKFPVLAPYLRT
jgi:CRISPR type III-A-associated RAMP protein Csm5